MNKKYTTLYDFTVLLFMTFLSISIFNIEKKTKTFCKKIGKVVINHEKSHFCLFEFFSFYLMFE